MHFSRNINSRAGKHIQVIRTAVGCLLMASVLLPWLARGAVAVYADGEPSVTLKLSDEVIHSGARLTLTAELSSPAAYDLSIAVAGGGNSLTVDVPKGQSAGSVAVKAGEYKALQTETYSLSPGEHYAVPDHAEVKLTVLPKPRLSFNADYYSVAPGAKLDVTMKCTNASEMTLPLPVSLRLADGTVVERVEFSPEKPVYHYKLDVPKDWSVPYYLVMYNEAARKQGARINVKMLDLERQKGIFSVDTEEKKIAISFDCGFNNIYTQYILDTLDEYGIKCTFFVTGVFVSGFPDMLKEIHKRGHEIGNHTARHKSLPKLTEEEVFNEVKAVNDAVYKKTGVTPKVLRPPYGSGNYNVHNVIRMAGCEVIYWSHDSLDWDPERTVKEIITRATKDIKGGSIVLFHNSAPKTKQTLRSILDKYKEMGYEIVPVSELIYHNYFTIDKMGVQKLKQGYRAVKPSEILGDYNPVIPVTGASAEGQPPVSLALKTAPDDAAQVRAEKDIAKIRSDPSLMEVTFDCGETVAAPISAGDSIGTATFSYNNEVWFTAAVTALNDVPAYRSSNEDDVGGRTSVVSSSDSIGIPLIKDRRRLTLAADGAIILCLACISTVLYMKNRRK